VISPPPTAVTVSAASPSVWSMFPGRHGAAPTVGGAIAAISVTGYLPRGIRKTDGALFSCEDVPRWPVP
jgi:hypothetical protein